MVTTLKRTTSEDPDFRKLVRLLDEYMQIIDGNEHAFYAQFNKLDLIKNAVVFYQDEVAAGCGALKKYGEKTVEIRRMFVHPDFRGKGIGAAVLNELEMWAAELNFSECILETSQKLKPAILLYQKTGYRVIPNYGQYEHVENSICMKKRINS